MPKLCLHGEFLVPHLAINADVPVLVHHNKVITLEQHMEALQAGRLCGHREVVTRQIFLNDNFHYGTQPDVFRT